MGRILLAMVLVLTPALAAAAEEGGRVTVTGVGEVAAAPDMAMIRLGVVEEAESAAEAMRAVSGASAAILERIGAAGIAPRDVQTSDLSMGPVWADGGPGLPRIAGFEARNTLMVRVRDLASLGAVLDAVLEAGANRFEGLSFSLQDPEPVADEARRRAVADAARKAALYAEAAGVTLGPILEISESGGARPQPMEMAMARMADAMPIAEGEVATQAQVTIVWAIAE